MADRTDIAQILSLFEASFSSFKMSEKTPDAYLAFLGDLPADLVKAAVMQCCSMDRAFAPSAGEIRAVVNDIRRQTSGIPLALEAWEEVKKAPKDGLIKSVKQEDGGWVIEKRHYEWSSEVVKQTARQLGWPNFPNPENEALDRAHFLKHYEYMVEKVMEEVGRLPLVGDYIEKNLISGKVKQLTDKLSVNRK